MILRPRPQTGLPAGRFPPPRTRRLRFYLQHAPGMLRLADDEAAFRQRQRRLWLL